MIFMCWMVPIIMSAISVAQSAQQAQQNKVSAALAAQRAKEGAGEAGRQAGLYDQQAREAINDGERERAAYMHSASSEQAEQRAAQGASGLDVNSASSRDFLSAAAAEAADRAGGIRLDAARRARTYSEQARSARLQAVDYRNQARLSQWQGRQAGKKLLLGAAGNLAKSIGGAAEN